MLFRSLPVAMKFFDACLQSLTLGVGEVGVEDRRLAGEAIPVISHHFAEKSAVFVEVLKVTACLWDYGVVRQPPAVGTRRSIDEFSDNGDVKVRFGNERNNTCSESVAMDRCRLRVAVAVLQPELGVCVCG